MKQNNWEIIEKEFDKKFPNKMAGVIDDFGNGVNKELKQFLRQTIIDILDEAIGEEREPAKPRYKSNKYQISNMPDKTEEGVVGGYNQKRSEIIKLKERLK